MSPAIQKPPPPGALPPSVATIEKYLCSFCGFSDEDCLALWRRTQHFCCGECDRRDTHIGPLKRLDV